MKNLIITLVSILLIVACQSVDEPINENVEPIHADEFVASRTISPERACDIAKQAMKDFEFKVPSRSSMTCSAHFLNNRKASRGENTIDSTFYIVNFDEGGFAVVAADKDDPHGIYMIGENGTFEDSQNPSSEFYLNYLAQNVIPRDSLKWPGKDLPFNPTPFEGNWDEEYIDEDGNWVRAKHTISIYANYTETFWHQYYPYNYYCPKMTSTEIDMTKNNGTYDLYKEHYTTGVLPTALAVVCAYNKFPKNYKGWDLLWDDITSDHYVRSIDDSGAMGLAFLIRGIGDMCKIKYGMWSTFIKLEELGLNAMVKLGYEKADYSTNINDVFAAINRGEIAVVAGHGKQKNSEGSYDYFEHAWVVDAHKILYRNVSVYAPGSSIPFSKYTTTDHYLSFNWCWGGNNRYFCLAKAPFYSGQNYIDSGITYLINLTPNN